MRVDRRVAVSGEVLRAREHAARDEALRPRGGASARRLSAVSPNARSPMIGFSARVWTSATGAKLIVMPSAASSCACASASRATNVDVAEVADAAHRRERQGRGAEAHDAATFLIDRRRAAGGRRTTHRGRRGRAPRRRAWHRIEPVGPSDKTFRLKRTTPPRRPVANAVASSRPSSVPASPTTSICPQTTDRGPCHRLWSTTIVRRSCLASLSALVLAGTAAASFGVGPTPAERRPSNPAQSAGAGDGCVRGPPSSAKRAPPAPPGPVARPSGPADGARSAPVHARPHQPRSRYPRARSGRARRGAADDRRAGARRGHGASRLSRSLGQRRFRARAAPHRSRRLRHGPRERALLHRREEARSSTRSRSIDPKQIERAESLFFDEVPPNDGHRKNILKPHHTKVGIGVAQSDRDGDGARRAVLLAGVRRRLRHVRRRFPKRRRSARPSTSKARSRAASGPTAWASRASPSPKPLSAARAEQATELPGPEAVPDVLGPGLRHADSARRSRGREFAIDVPALGRPAAGPLRGQRVGQARRVRGADDGEPSHDPRRVALSSRRRSARARSRSASRVDTSCVVRRRAGAERGRAVRSDEKDGAPREERIARPPLVLARC